MAKHTSKETILLMEEAVEKFGFRIQWKAENQIGYLYPPEKEYPPRLVHVGEAAIKKVRSYLKNYEKWKKSR
jgi:hypothetical protein